MQKWINVILFIFIGVLFTSCLATRHRKLFPIPGEYIYTAPVDKGDGLTCAALDNSVVGFEMMSRVNSFFGRLKKGEFGEIHGILVSIDGSLVIEEYFPGYEFKGGFTHFTSNDPHNLASITKSVTSLLVGIAIDNGFIMGVDQSFTDFYKNESIRDKEYKSNITIRHLLTMSAGFCWDETSLPYTNIFNDVVRLYNSIDPQAYLLGLKTKEAPGSRWTYNGASPNLLGDIVSRGSGLKLDEFADKYLFEPMGIKDVTWIHLRNGFIYASGDARLKPRDMIKIGQLMAMEGIWNGKRIVSDEWIKESVTPAFKVDESSDYGYMWWLPRLPYEVMLATGPIYTANGWGDQYIVIIPKLDIVCVVTGGNYYNSGQGIYPILSGLMSILLR